ncbi:MAG TPA: S-layer homology domain-containing protein [bacterium]|nr:S-layer homology domain-containing protein [bacterium]
MRHIAVITAAVVMFAMVAPAFAQPFADVPTNHWAYDAIAELAAKGLVEGYPDGTFKGDRAMTRYEMAMVVARLLARIESIQIPAPAPAPQVTKADLDALQRLINEFRAELAALGVRVTAIEEELNAIKARLDNVRISGNWRFRYDGGPSASGASLNGNANAFATDSGTSPTTFRARQGLKLIFDGSVAPDIHAIIGLDLAAAGTSTPATFNSSRDGGNFTSSPNYAIGDLAEAYLDWNHAWGWPLRIQLGRMGGIQQGFGTLPIQFGPFGLLLNTNSDTYEASTDAATCGCHLFDGLRLSGNVPAWADFTWQAVVGRIAGPTGGSSYFLGEDAYGADANIRVIPGLRVGAYWVANNINSASTVVAGAPSALYHVYGPVVPMTNPVTGRCLVTTPSTIGITCPALGSGGGGYATWDVVPGIKLDGEVASWNDGTAGGGSDSAYFVDAVVDLGAMTGIGHKLALTLSYENAGQNFYAPYQNDVDYDIAGTVGPGNAQMFTGDLSFDFTDQWGFLGAYETGNNISNGQGITEWRVGVVYRFAPGARIYTRIENQRINGVSQYTLYRSQLDYTF